MKKLFAVLALVLAACSDKSRGPLAATDSQQDLTFVTVAPVSIQSDPFWIAEPYTREVIFDSLSATATEFAWDPDAVSDAEFDSAGAQLLTTPLEFSYTSNGFEVEAGVIAILESGGGGGGGGGGELESTTSGAGGYCEDQYNRIIARCRRVPSAKGRALCYGGAMAVYAGCRATQSGPY